MIYLKSYHPIVWYHISILNKRGCHNITLNVWYHTTFPLCSNFFYILSRRIWRGNSVSHWTCFPSRLLKREMKWDIILLKTPYEKSSVNSFMKMRKKYLPHCEHRASFQPSLCKWEKNVIKRKIQKNPEECKMFWPWRMV